MSKQNQTITGLIRNLRLLLAEVLLGWALTIMPEGYERYQLAGFILKYWSKVGKNL